MVLAALKRAFPCTKLCPRKTLTEDAIGGSEEQVISLKQSLATPETYLLSCRDMLSGWVTYLVTVDVSLLRPHLLWGSSTFASVGGREQFLFEGIFLIPFRWRAFRHLLHLPATHWDVTLLLPTWIAGMCWWVHQYLLWKLQLFVTCRAIPLCQGNQSFPLLCQLTIHFLRLHDGRWTGTCASGQSGSCSQVEVHSSVNPASEFVISLFASGNC